MAIVGFKKYTADIHFKNTITFSTARSIALLNSIDSNRIAVAQRPVIKRLLQTVLFNRVRHRFWLGT